MTWAGLRGGISVALSVPIGYTREVILAITYVVVVFSVLVQGLTIGKVVRKQSLKNPEGSENCDRIRLCGLF